MKNKKITTLVASLALVAALGIGATLAYFSDSDEAVNTITMGKIDMDLEEPKFDPDGDGEGEIDDVDPGDSVYKDPTIIVKAGSEDAYLRAKITYEGLTDEKIEQLEAGITFSNGWVKSTDGYYYYQFKVEKDSEKNQTIPFFTEVKIPFEWNDMADKTFKINVNAEAIQANHLVLSKDENDNINGWNDPDGLPIDMTEES